VHVYKHALKTLCILTSVRCVHYAAVQTTPDAPAAAKERLKSKGALSKGEVATLASLGVAVAMWVMGEQLKVRENNSS
jgi:uncharacterized protein HemX